MKRPFSAILFATALFSGLAAASLPANATTILSMQTSGALQTSSTTLQPIPGLQVILPAATNKSKYALVILDIPMPYAEGHNYPGAEFKVSVDGVAQSLSGGFTADAQDPPGFGRHPVTLSLRVKLTSSQQSVLGMWVGIRGSTVKIDTPASLSAIVE